MLIMNSNNIIIKPNIKQSFASFTLRILQFVVVENIAHLHIQNQKSKLNSLKISLKMLISICFILKPAVVPGCLLVTIMRKFVLMLIVWMKWEGKSINNIMNHNIANIGFVIPKRNHFNKGVRKFLLVNMFTAIMYPQILYF